MNCAKTLILLMLRIIRMLINVNLLIIFNIILLISRNRSARIGEFKVKIKIHNFAWYGSAPLRQI